MNLKRPSTRRLLDGAFVIRLRNESCFAGAVVGWLMASLVLVVMTVTGCSDAAPVADEVVPARKLLPISVLFVDTPGVAEKVARQWAAERNGEVIATEISTEMLFENDYSAASKMDVIVYPGQLTGQLVADKQLALLSDDVWNSESFEHRGLLRHGRTTLSKFGRNRVSIPLGSPQFFILYRKDRLEAWNTNLPVTWEDLRTLKLRLDVSSGSEKGISKSIMIPCANGWAAKSFLAIAACEIRQRGNLDTLFDRRTMKPLLFNKPFVEALTTLKTLSTYSRDMDPAAVTRALLDGESGIAVSWPAKAFAPNEPGEELAERVNKIAVARLPGTKRSFDFATEQWEDTENNELRRVGFVGFESRQAAVLNSASQPMDVDRFLEWLGSKQAGSFIFSGSYFGAPSRAAHLGNTQNWTGEVLDQTASDHYADLFIEVNEEPVFLTFPRIRGSHRYMAELESSIQKFLAGETDENTAMQEASDAWEKITDEYGREDQIELLRKDQTL